MGQSCLLPFWQKLEKRALSVAWPDCLPASVRILANATGEWVRIEWVDAVAAGIRMEWIQLLLGVVVGWSSLQTLKCAHRIVMGVNGGKSMKALCASWKQSGIEV